MMHSETNFYFAIFLVTYISHLCLCHTHCIKSLILKIVTCNFFPRQVKWLQTYFHSTWSIISMSWAQLFNLSILRTKPKLAPSAERASTGVWLWYVIWMCSFWAEFGGQVGSPAGWGDQISWNTKLVLSSTPPSLPDPGNGTYSPDEKLENIPVSFKWEKKFDMLMMWDVLRTSFLLRLWL